MSVLVPQIDVLLQEADRVYPSPELSVYVYFWTRASPRAILIKNCETFASAAVRICIEELSSTFQDAQTCLIYVYSTAKNFFMLQHTALSSSSFVLDVFLEIVSRILSGRDSEKNITDETWATFQKEWAQGQMGEEVRALGMIPPVRTEKADQEGGQRGRGSL